MDYNVQVVKVEEVKDIRIYGCDQQPDPPGSNVAVPMWPSV